MAEQTINPEQVKAALEAAVAGCRVEILHNGSPAAQHSLIVDNEHAVEAALFLRDDSALRLDFCSDVAGVDWLDAEVTEKVKTKKLVDGAETEVEETRKTVTPGYLEVVYHLFSMEKKHGPVVVRLRTADRGDGARVPSLTPVWRSAEFQEREAFDLYGIVFEGHPDLRRILMWDEFKDYPMRKDYKAPDDDAEPAAQEGAQ